MCKLFVYNLNRSKHAVLSNCGCVPRKQTHTPFYNSCFSKNPNCLYIHNTTPHYCIYLYYTQSIRPIDNATSKIGKASGTDLCQTTATTTGMGYVHCCSLRASKKIRREEQMNPSTDGPLEDTRTEWQTDWYGTFVSFFQYLLVCANVSQI